MSIVLEHYREAMERYQFQMGSVRGGLATALDMLTDALALVGQHGVYCRSVRQPQYPAMDVRLVMEQIEESKGLIIAAMEELKKKPE
ncbi:MAG: hypothetical protein DMG13_13790 [Acidobacteria bacterium]|nr:MAG: hypothetical protein DMG13_13790 [Acidobacteriota bacterium]